MERKYKILFKYPSRQRRERFLQGLDSILENLHDQENFQILVTADIDDPEMRDLPQYIIDHPRIRVQYGTSKSKIHAVNRDMEFADDDWDIVVVMSDDFRIIFDGFDEVVRGQYKEHGLDTLLHSADQDAKNLLATMYIAGKDFYNRFGYIYHPQFLSVWCDNLVQDIAQLLGKYVYFDCTGLILHLNPAYGHLERDEMFDEQQGHWEHDEKLYREIRERGYDLHLIKTD